MIQNKAKTREELAELIPKLKKQGKKVGFTSGAFDIIHAGHITYLEDARKICDVLIIGLNTDASVKKYKGENRPINNQEDRLKIISSLEPVDYVFLFDDRRNNVNIETLKPDFYIKGGDYSPDTLTSKPVVEKHGGKAVVLPIEKGKSTTELIKKVMMDVKSDKKNDEKTSYAKINKHSKISQAIFIDRDGVINKEISYLHEPEKFEFLPNVLEGMKKMQGMGFKIVVVTNQAGIGLGYFTKEDFYKVNRVMLKGVSKAGIMIDKIYFCPHGINDDCDCRKPKPGMLLRGKQELNLDMKNSYMIGDMTSDIKAGENAGTKTILVKTGYGGKDGGDAIKSDYVAEDLLDAAEFILKDQRNL